MSNVGIWPEWFTKHPLELARYINVEAIVRAANLSTQIEHPLPTPHDLRASGQQQVLVERIYDALLQRQPPIQYTFEKETAYWNPSHPRQAIRRPSEIFGPGAHEGTCLDLSLVFAGLCLQYGLVPFIVLMDDHALVLISRVHTRTSWLAETRAANSFKLQFIDGHGLLDGDAAQGFIELSSNRGMHVPVECTGFARTQTLSTSFPEGQGRDAQGFLSFERASEAGREQFEQRQVRCIIDVVYTQQKEQEGDNMYNPEKEDKDEEAKGTSSGGNTFTVGNIIGSSGVAIGENIRLSVNMGGNQVPDTFDEILTELKELNLDSKQQQQAEFAIEQIRHEEEGSEPVLLEKIKPWLEVLASVGASSAGVFVRSVLDPGATISSGLRSAVEAWDKSRQ